MKYKWLVLAMSTVATGAISAPVMAAESGETKPKTAWEASRSSDDSDMITTGVARGRDRLNSATSTSSIQENEISKLAPRTLAELFRNIPGVRVEAGSGDGANNYTIRGLPLVDSGAKYLQLQEDGLPVLEFGDFLVLSPDNFIRADLNVSEVQAIRGGSASTFASNAPGGVINLISKTGEVEGGSVQLTTGLDYDRYRMDFDYGGHLSENWRFHVGGFMREGEGPHNPGYNAYRGAQLKFNVTREFDGGYIRFYGKYLDDRFPTYLTGPLAVSGTDANPSFSNVPGFSPVDDTLLSRNIATQYFVDRNDQLVAKNMHKGFHVKAKAFGVEAKFDVGGWSVTDRFRYANQSGELIDAVPYQAASAAGLAYAFGGGVGATLRYASGPNAGTTITDPTTLNGNGLLSITSANLFQIKDAGNITNDLRLSRVWDVGGGELTATAGLYKSRQELNEHMNSITELQDVIGNGQSSLIDVYTESGLPVTYNGVLTFGTAGVYNRIYDVTYDVTAPYGSINFMKGRFALGASVRYDAGKVDGTTANDNGAVRSIDLNGDGLLIGAENTIPYVPAANHDPVHYHYDYLSYSASANFRVSEPFSMFARYSRGSRAGADRLLFSPAIDPGTGKLVNKPAAYDPVRQTEVGVKYRKNGVTLNLTGFYATSSETTTQLNSDSAGNIQLELVARSYKAYGLEFEGGIRRGPFSVTAGATLTGAEITKAQNHPELIGNTPRHQAALIYQVTPQYDTELFTVGANFVGTTKSYAQDNNLLRMPGFTTVGAFVQFRPVERVELSVNASNLFNTLAIVGTTESAIPASGVVSAQTLMGRTVSGSVRFYF